MTPAQLSDAVLRSVRQAVDRGALVADVPARAAVRRPPHGDADWSTGIALGLAGPAGRPAREVAELLGAALRAERGVARVSVDGPGFVNVWLDRGADAGVVRDVLALPEPPRLPEDPAEDVRRWAAAAGGDPAGLLVQRESNPLFRARYAHARARAAVRGGQALGTGPDAGETATAAERELVALLAERERLGAAPGYLVRVADALLAAPGALPLGDEKPGAVHRARLALAQAAGTVLADGLYRLGVSAPDHL